MAVLLAAGCGDDGGGDSAGGDEESQSTTTVVEATTTTTAPEEVATTTDEASTPDGEEYESAEDEIVARYIAYWDARFEANSPPDPEHPDLAEYACCDQLDHVRSETEEHLESGHEFQRPDDPVDMRWVEVISHDGDEATVQECVVSEGVVVDSTSGEVVNDDVVTYNVRGEMRRIDGEWRLSRATELQSWEGVAGCIHAQ